MGIATATAIITTIIAVLVAIITWGQWVTNRARLRHELFDRRYEMYQRISIFIAGVLQTGGVEPSGDSAFLRNTKQAYFVFGCDDEIKQLVDEIYTHAVLLQTLQVKEKGLSGDPLKTNLDKQLEAKQWFQATLMSLERKFEKYLRLRH